MRNKTLLFAAVLLLTLLYAGCKKDSQSRTPIPQNDLIAQARQYFTEKLASMPPGDDPGLLTQVKKTPAWNSAYTMQLSMGPAVVVPLSYDKDVHVSPSFSGGKTFALNSLAKLLVYKAPDGSFRHSVIIGLPDKEYADKPGGHFSGIAIVEDWAGNVLKEYRYAGSNIYSRSAGAGASSVEQSTLSQSTRPQTIIQVCYSFTTCVGTVDNPYDYCTTQDLGCSSTYVQDVPSDPGGGGGGPSGGDVGGVGGGGGGGGASGSVGENALAGVPCTATPILTYNTNNIVTARAVNTGVYLFSNVIVTFDFDRSTFALDKASVKTTISGLFVGSWTQDGVRGIFLSGVEINFIIDATEKVTIPGTTIEINTPHTIYAQYNVLTNTIYFSNQ